MDERKLSRCGGLRAFRAASAAATEAAGTQDVCLAVAVRSMANRRGGRALSKAFAMPVLMLLLAVAGLAAPTLGSAQYSYVEQSAGQRPVQAPPNMDRVSVEEKLGGQVPSDLEFTDQRGRKVRLSDYFDGERPVVLNLAYHSCEVLCNMVVNATIESLKQVPWTAGQDYRVLSVSIDPRDTPKGAKEKRTQALASYGREAASKDWNFLVGQEPQIERLADAVGFRYFYDERQELYAHSAVMMLLTPDGKVARYLYGLSFPPEDVRLGLLEASRGKSTSSLEKVLIYCYQYDPAAGGYVVVAARVMQIGGGLVALVLGVFLVIFWRREFKRRPDGDGADDDSVAAAGPPTQVAS